MYEISINLVPEVFNGKEMFFWCIFGNNNGAQHNCGHGWSVSVEEAAKDAYEYYNKAIKENTNA
jgi:hypothetical protein